MLISGMDNFEIGYNKGSLEPLVYPVILPFDSNCGKYKLTPLDNERMDFAFIDVQKVMEEF